MGRSSKDKRDIFYRLAKEEGFRARSAFKLLQIAQQFDLFNGVHRAVDLCAAPGSWSQVLAQALKPYKNNSDKEEEKSDNEDETFIVAVDLQAMSPIPGVICLQGDITKESTANDIISSLGDKKAELVVSDGAPDVTGLHQLDEYLQGQLLLAALNIATFVLAPNGTFLAKIFRASQDGVNTLYAKVKVFFEDVLITKPRSSRASSIESFLLARNFRLPKNYTPRLYDPFSNLEELLETVNSTEKEIIRFVACGDLNGFDSDTTYPINSPDYQSRAPVQNPIAPPYEMALALRRQNKNVPASSLNLPSSTTSTTAPDSFASSSSSLISDQQKNNQEDNIMENESAKKDEVNELTNSLMKLELDFGGGAELLVGDVKNIEIKIPYNLEKPLKIGDLLEWMRTNVITDRPELLIKDGDVRPGILVLINDTDWELLDKIEYELEESDKISFISTLHGG